MTDFKKIAGEILKRKPGSEDEILAIFSEFGVEVPNASVDLAVPPDALETTEDDMSMLPLEDARSKSIEKMFGKKEKEKKGDEVME